MKEGEIRFCTRPLRKSPTVPRDIEGHHENAEEFLNCSWYEEMKNHLLWKIGLDEGVFEDMELPASMSIAELARVAEILAEYHQSTQSVIIETPDGNQREIMSVRQDRETGAFIFKVSD